MRRLHLPIHDPCHEDWDAMEREGQARRFCDVCTKQVHDLSALTETEAREVLAEEFTKGRVCVRYKTTTEGHIKFAPEAGTVTYATSALRSMMAAAGMSLMLMTGCVDTNPNRVEDDRCVYEVGPWSFTTARGEGRCPAPEPELVGVVEINVPGEIEPPPEPEMGEIIEEPEPPAVKGEIEPVRELKGKVAPPAEIEPEIEMLGDIAVAPKEFEDHAAPDEPCDGKPEQPGS